MATRTDFVTLDDLRYTAFRLDGSHQKAIRQKFQRNSVETATYIELMGYFKYHGIKIRKAPKRKPNAS